MEQEDIIHMIPIYVMGKRYDVPQGLTILKALEFAGYQLTRGCGCRGGVCGACVTVYRKEGDYRLGVGLACQTVVEADMYLAQLPYVPANKPDYSISHATPEDLKADRLYPELIRCVGCNTCTKACPMELDVMEYVSAAKRGDMEKVVELSMECVMCGICASRCPAELSPFNIALLIRRAYGKHVVPPSPQLNRRLGEIREGIFDKEIEALKRSEEALLKERFQELQATKGAAV
jgi:ferredoxin